MENDDSLVEKQIEYYRARASEYDEWFLRTGRYDRGEEHRQQWFAEADIVREALVSAKPHGDILELACGTGLWTQHLLSDCTSLTVVDSSPEALELCRERLGDSRVEYIQADLFKWTPSRRYDFIFFSFWLSHIPLTRFDSFWIMLRAAQKDQGSVFFVDSLLTQQSTAKDHAQLDRSGRAMRKLNDGREYEIVKIFHEPKQLELKLSVLGWQGMIRATPNFFLYGNLSLEKNLLGHDVQV